MEKPTPKTPDNPATPTIVRPPRAGTLAALAGAALLLGACAGGGSGLPDILDLPAYDPEPGSAEDAFLYPHSDLVISAIDGRDIFVGNKYWLQLAKGADDLIPLGPRSHRYEKSQHVVVFEMFRHDSVLLSPGRHEIEVRALITDYKGNDVFGLLMSPWSRSLSFTAEPRATYRLVRRDRVPASADDPFSILVVKSACPLKDGGWVWPLEWGCYKSGEIVASLDPAYVGMRLNEVFKVE